MKTTLHLLVLWLLNNINSCSSNYQLENLIKDWGCAFTYVHYLTLPREPDINFRSRSIGISAKRFYRTSQVTYLDYARWQLELEFGADITFEIAVEAKHRKQRYKADMDSTAYRKIYKSLSMIPGRTALGVLSTEDINLDRFDAMVRRQHLYCTGNCNGDVVGKVGSKEISDESRSVLLRICVLWLGFVIGASALVFFLELVMHYRIVGKTGRFMESIATIIREVFANNPSSE